jgi:Mrp family chromosome partitioning ATPase
LRYFNVDKELRTLLVASAAPGDGKTTVARHLAGAAARMGARVFLVEADLRRPTIAQQFDISPGPGLADVLIGAVAMNEAVQAVAMDLPQVEAVGGRTLDVLVADSYTPEKGSGAPSP